MQFWTAHMSGRYQCGIQTLKQRQSKSPSKFTHSPIMIFKNKHPHHRNITPTHRKGSQSKHSNMYRTECPITHTKQFIQCQIFINQAADHIQIKSCPIEEIQYTVKPFILAALILANLSTNLFWRP